MTETDPLALVKNPVGINQIAQRATLTDPFSDRPVLICKQGANQVLDEIFAVHHLTDPPPAGLYFDSQTLGLWTADNQRANSEYLVSGIKDHTDPAYPYSTVFKTDILSYDNNTAIIRLGDPNGDGTFSTGVQETDFLVKDGGRLLLNTSPNGTVMGVIEMVGAVQIDNPGSPVQVGLPTGATGVANTANKSDHRHAFSGRFYVGGFTRLGVLAGNPLKFARFKIANNFTVRRISVYALTAPTGANGETWGIVNAAGATQGTAVALNNGVQENEVAQTTNLTGNTAYYIAQIGVSGGTASLDVNVEVEYTMNV